MAGEVQRNDMMVCRQGFDLAIPISKVESDRMDEDDRAALSRPAAHMFRFEEVIVLLKRPRTYDRKIEGAGVRRSVLDVLDWNSASLNCSSCKRPMRTSAMQSAMISREYQRAITFNSVPSRI